MNKLILLCISMLFLGCQDSKTQPNISDVQTSKKIEFINVLVFQGGQLQINGQKISESALESHLIALPIGKETKTRIFLDKNAWSGSVSNVQSLLLHQKLAVNNMSVKVFDSKTFAKIGHEILMIDILDDDIAQVNGNNIHTNDLVLALNSHKETATQVWFSISEKVTIGPVFDVQTNAYRLGYDLTFL